MSLKVAPPEEIAKLRAESDEREAKRRKMAQQEKEERQLRRVASFVKAVSWLKGLFTPAPAPEKRGRSKRTKLGKVRKYNERRAKRAHQKKAGMKPDHWGAVSTLERQGHTAQERMATRKSWAR